MRRKHQHTISTIIIIGFPLVWWKIQKGRTHHRQSLSNTISKLLVGPSAARRKHCIKDISTSKRFTHLSTILQSQQQWLTFRLIDTTMLAAPWKVGSHKQNFLTCMLHANYAIDYIIAIDYDDLVCLVPSAISHIGVSLHLRTYRFGQCVARSTWLSQQCQS